MRLVAYPIVTNKLRYHDTYSDRVTNWPRRQRFRHVHQEETGGNEAINMAKKEPADISPVKHKNFDKDNDGLFVSFLSLSNRQRRSTDSNETARNFYSYVTL
jgi:hypothetical protein